MNGELRKRVEYLLSRVPCDVAYYWWMREAVSVLSAVLIEEKTDV